MRHPDIAEIVRRDRRYAYEAYEFIFDALAHTQKRAGRLPQEGQKLGEEHHVTGQEIVNGAIDLARREFGLLARTVFRQWGITRSDDLGEIVFNLIEANLLSKTERDRRSDFEGICDLEQALTEGFTITLGDHTNPRRGNR